MTDGRKGSHKFTSQPESAGDIVFHKSAGDIVEERREAIANLCDNEREHHIQRSVGSFVFQGYRRNRFSPEIVWRNQFCLVHLV